VDKSKTCFFTGHRKIAQSKIEIVKAQLADNIEKMITEYGVNTFIDGGALGFDTIAAETVIEMREKYQNIKLVMYLPCYGQSKMWKESEQFRYRMVLSKADKIIYITESVYTDDCMKLRNLKMIKDSSFCIAFCLMQKSGTGFTLRNAENVGIQKVKNYVNMLPQGKVPVISEYGIFRSTSPLLRSQTHAVYIAKVLMEYVRLGSPYIQKHCLVDWYSSGADSLGPTQQAVIQAVPQTGANQGTGEGNFRFFSTPSAKVFELFSNSFAKGTKVVGTEFEHVETLANGTKAYSAIASKGDDGTLYVTVVNTDRENDKKLRVKVDGVDLTGKTVEVQTLAGESFVDENSLAEPDKVTIENSTVTAEGTDLELTAKAHSVMSITVKEKVDPPAPETYTVTAKANNTDMGTVTIDPVKDKYNAGEKVTATATAKEGYEFVNWTVDGEAVSTEATYEFTVDKNVELTANFKETEKPVEKFTVTAKVNDSKMGTVKLDPDKAEYAKGEKVTATATAKEGYEFVNWTVAGKAVSTEATYEFTVDKNVELTANFKETEKPVEKVTITVKANDSKMGTVKLDPAKESYENGEIVTAIATAKEGYKFVNWTVAGKVVSDKAEYKFKVDRAAELQANFVKVSEDPKPENPKDEDKAVQTGDNGVSPIIPLAGLMLAAGAAVVALRKKED